MNTVNIYFLLPVSLNDFNTVVDVANAALTQNIEFFKSDIFGHIHIPLSCWKPFRRKIKCSITGNWFFRDQHATRMNGTEIGKILHQRTYRKYLAVQLTSLSCGNRIIGQQINFVLWKSIYLPQFAHD